MAFVDAHYPWIALLLFVLGGLTWIARQDYLRHQVSESFDLLKPANELRPEDLGFQVVRSEEETELEGHFDPNLRPFHESTYVSRLAVLYERYAEKHPEPYYDEHDLISSLREGKGFVLIGPPADGKTRTLYEIVRHMDDYEVLRLKADEKIPEKADLSFLLHGRRVVLLLDDLGNPKYREPDLLELAKRLSECDVPCVVASTCQDGSELTRVQTELGRLFDRMSLKLWLVGPTAQQKSQLAKSVWDKPWDPEKSDAYPTLGSIAMAEAMATMRRRFNVLLHEHREQADMLRALKLLAHAGVRPYTHERLQAVLRHEQLFRRRDLRLHEILEDLTSQAFLRFGSREQVQPESAYLRAAVTYSSGKEPEDDFSKLADVLEGISDTEGLFSLGTTFALALRGYEEARACFERAVDLKPGDVQILLSKSEGLLRLGKLQDASSASQKAVQFFEEALNACEEAIRLKPDYPQAWFDKSITLRELRMYQEALEASEEAIRLKPDYPQAWFNTSDVLIRRVMDRGATSLVMDAEGSRSFPEETSETLQEALEASEEAIRLKPDYPQAWFNKGQALSILGMVQHKAAKRDSGPVLLLPGPGEATSAAREQITGLSNEALNAYNEAIRLKPNFPYAWVGKSSVLLEYPGYGAEALEAIEEAIRLKPDYHFAWNVKSTALYQLGKYQESVHASREAVRLESEVALYWRNLSSSLIALGKDYSASNSEKPEEPEIFFEEALHACREAIRLKSDFPGAWFDKIVALDFLERYQEALSTSEEAIILWPEDPNFWGHKGMALARLGHREEARQWLCRAWRERSRCSIRVGTLEDFLRYVGGRPEDCE